MSGLDKIIEKINADSASKCSEILSDAEAQSRQIAEAARQDGEKACEEIKAAAEKQAQSVLKMSQANCQQQARRAVLAAKVRAVDETIAAAAQALDSMPEGEYFESLKSLASKNVCRGEGIMYLNSRDIKRLPDGFEASVNSVLPEGCSVKIAASAADIRNGFILVYGDIEINCTFDAIIESQKDAIKEKVCSIIF